MSDFINIKELCARDMNLFKLNRRIAIHRRQNKSRIKDKEVIIALDLHKVTD